MSSGDGLVHREVLELQATPDQARAFIMTPERIADYYAGSIESGVFEAGGAIWCRGESSVSMLELVPDESTDDCMVTLVTTALGLEPPYTRQGIRDAATFTMVEDWGLAPSAGGTTLTRSWRDIVTSTDLGFALDDAIRQSAESESEPLVKAWNEAARTDARARPERTVHRNR